MSEREPPREGEALCAALKRGDDELRVSWDSFTPEGKSQTYNYLSLRIWTQGDGGQWIPTKKGVTVRPKELEQVAKAIARAIQKSSTK